MRIAFLLLLTLIGSSQIHGSNLIIRDVNQQYNLGRNIVNCMFQDSIGFLWFGMANGLYKFDSNTFTHYSHQESNSYGFPIADVRAIVEYSPGILLVGTFDKGLIVFNSKTERYYPIRSDAPFDFSSLYVRSLFFDSKGNIWVGTLCGLYQIKHKGEQPNDFVLINQFNAI